MARFNMLELEGDRYHIKLYVTDSRQRNPAPGELWWDYTVQTMLVDKRTGMKRFFYLHARGDHWKWNFEEAAFNAREKITHRLTQETRKAFIDRVGIALFAKLADQDEFPFPDLHLQIGRRSKTSDLLDLDIDLLESEGILRPKNRDETLAA